MQDQIGCWVLLLLDPPQHVQDQLGVPKVKEKKMVETRETRHFQGRKERFISGLKTLFVFADEFFSSLIAKHALATPSRKGTHPPRRASRLTLNREEKELLLTE